MWGSLCGTAWVGQPMWGSLGGVAYVVVSFPDHFSPHGKNWSGERPTPFSFPAVAKIVT